MASELKGIKSYQENIFKKCKTKAINGWQKVIKQANIQAVAEAAKAAVFELHG